MEDQDNIFTELEDILQVISLDDHEYPRITSRYSPDKIQFNRDSYRPHEITIDNEYLTRICRRFQPQSPDMEYVRILANAHLHDIINKLSAIKSSRDGKVVTNKDLQILLQLEGVHIIQ